MNCPYGFPRVCIVGQGPSAEGRGREIDACDFVVRIKAFWRFGAVGAGTRVDAVAWFGTQEREWRERPKDVVPRECEHWRTWSDRQYREAYGQEWKKARAFFLSTATQFGGRFWSIGWDLWHHAVVVLRRQPSTGFVAVQMALECFPRCELVLIGFDATTKDRADYWDARRPKGDDVHAVHDMVAEKRALAEIERGRFLGRKCEATLDWIGKPRI